MRVKLVSDPRRRSARHVALIVVYILFASISVSIIASQAERSPSKRKMHRDRAGFDSLAEKRARA